MGKKAKKWLVGRRAFMRPLPAALLMEKPVKMRTGKKRLYSVVRRQERHFRNPWLRALRFSERPASFAASETRARKGAFFICCTPFFMSLETAEETTVTADVPSHAPAPQVQANEVAQPRKGKERKIVGYATAGIGALAIAVSGTTYALLTQSTQRAAAHAESDKPVRISAEDHISFLREGLSWSRKRAEDASHWQAETDDKTLQSCLLLMEKWMKEVDEVRTYEKKMGNGRIPQSSTYEYLIEQDVMPKIRLSADSLRLRLQSASAEKTK